MSSTWMVSAFVTLATSTVAAQGSAELVLRQPPFDAYSAFWPNLHHTLLAESLAHLPPSEESARGRLPTPLSGDLIADERRTWDAAVAYYAAEIADLHPLFEMRSIRKAMIAAGSALSAEGLDPSHHKVLAAAAPVYRKHWWPEHDRANRGYIADALEKVGSLSPRVPERLARLYGEPWFSEGIRVDVVPIASREGAFTSIEPAPAHITISSMTTAMQGWTAAEVLFHEAAHVLAFPLIDDVTAELRTQGKTSLHLWHVMLFYLTGEVVRQELAARQIEYRPYMYATGLVDRMWSDLRAPVEAHWKPYVDGAVPRDQAIRELVAAIPSTPRSLNARLLDIAISTKLTEIGTVFLLALWAVFFRPLLVNRWTLPLIGLVTAIQAALVRLVTIPVGNVVVHLAAIALSLLAARALSSLLNLRWNMIRLALGIIGAIAGYFAGRELAITLLSSVVT